MRTTNRDNRPLMDSQGARSLGITLLLAVGVLAVLLVAGVFSPEGVGAHPCPPVETPHEDFHEIPCGKSGHDDPHENVIEVDGGRDNEMVFRIYPPPSSPSEGCVIGGE